MVDEVICNLIWNGTTQQFNAIAEPNLGNRTKSSPKRNTCEAKEGSIRSGPDSLIMRRIAHQGQLAEYRIFLSLSTWSCLLLILILITANNLARVQDIQILCLTSLAVDDFMVSKTPFGELIAQSIELVPRQVGKEEV